MRLRDIAGKIDWADHTLLSWTSCRYSEAVSVPHYVTSLRRCLNILKVWQLTFPRGSDLREIKAEMIIMSFMYWTQKLPVMTYTALCWWSSSPVTEEGCRKEIATQQASAGALN